MTETGSKWRIDRPTEWYPTTNKTSQSLMYRTLIPDCYEPRYPYPLLVLFHQHGANEEQALDFVPRMSRRNFVTISLRGPELLGVQEDGQLACGWGNEISTSEMVNDFIVRAVHQTRMSYNIHSERVFFVGICEGAEAAYRAAFNMGDRIGGVACLNGTVPKVKTGAPLFRMDALRGLPVMIGHGIANSIIPKSQAEKDYRLLYSAGANVQFQMYPTTHRIHSEMLRDLNRWIISRLNSGTDRIANIS